MNFGEILSKAWKIIWKHKVLWIFGILAALGQGGGGGGNGGGGGGSRGYTGNGVNPFGNLPQDWGNRFNQFQNSFERIPIWIWIGIIFGLLLIIVVCLFLGTIGKTGLILGTSQADRSDDKIFFGKLFSGSLHFFWRVFGFSLLFGLAIFIAILVIVIPMGVLGVATMGVAIACLIPLLCVIFIAAWLVSILLEQTIITIVVKDTGMMDALKKGWEICKKNPWQLILMNLILSIGKGIVGFILALPIIAVMLPILIPVMSGNEKLFAPAIITSLALCCAYIPLLYLLDGIITAYVQSAWTLTNLRLTADTEPEIIPPVEVLPNEPPPVA